MTSPTIKTRASGPLTVESNRQPLRLKLKPQSPSATGYVDGAWWPRSRDLARELPALLSVLSVRLGHIERICYHLTEWDPTVRKISADGTIVRLAGYRAQRADTVDVLAARQRVSLLVVPPATSPEAAHRALMTAAHRGNTDSISELLAPIAPAPWTANGDWEAAEQRWELDGGR